ncbi:peptidoglycan-binding protein LysM [Tenacibaculum sp. C7A-26P2]|uniref:peptidoglycan-binding protein LysM n=1 Tax=Tenacibaculum sp. C7A-26P2 TaxID=3447504 RepID=UPI003F83C28D
MPALNGKYLIIRNLGTLFLLFLLSTSFTKNISKSKKEGNNKKTTKPIPEVVFKEDLNFPFLDKDFIGFREALAFKESQGKYMVVNKLGYLGKYQFGKSTLKRFKIYNTYNFLRDPELQEKTFIALCKVNKWILRKDISRFLGKKINGVVITESGILAAAHLSGAGNVKKYLRSYGKITFKDAFGTTIQDYIRKFKGYDVSNIIGDKYASA